MITTYVDTIQNPRYQSTFQKYGLTSKYNPRQSVVGHFLLADYMGVDVTTVLDKRNFNYGAHGKPSLKNAAFHYNIADSYDMVVLAVSNHEIGADLEKLRPYDYHRVKGGFRSDEIAFLERFSGAEQIKMTFKLWTIKEAVLKLTGMGLPGGVRSMAIDLDHFAFATRYGRKIILTPLNIGSEYIGTLAQYADQL